jgi:hypothetical protein
VNTETQENSSVKATQRTAPQIPVRIVYLAAKKIITKLSNLKKSIIPYRMDNFGWSVCNQNASKEGTI